MQRETRFLATFWQPYLDEHLSTELSTREHLKFKREDPEKTIHPTDRTTNHQTTGHRSLAPLTPPVWTVGDALRCARKYERFDCHVRSFAG
jgi:hypothetical protein